jgi:hypothetical protein
MCNASSVAHFGGSKKMDGSNFELIMQEVLNQKQYMDELLAENRELHRQLTALRAGHGIIIDIEGMQFALGSETFTNPFPVQVTPTTQATPATIELEPTATLSAVPMGTIPETPYPSTDEFAQIAQFSHKADEVEEEETPPVHTSPFLEEMLLDEFASAATSPMAVWKAPVTRKLTAIDEDQNAALRKELIGSFLLE